MIAIKKEELVVVDGVLTKRIEGECLSTDTLPTDVANGSQLLVIYVDTHSTQLKHYDQENETWIDVE